MLTELQARPTSMAVAFYQALIKVSVPTTRSGRVLHYPRLAAQVSRSIERNAGLVKERAVDARVSYRTAQKLKQEGSL